MNTPSPTSQAPNPKPGSLWRDGVATIVITAASIALAAYFNLDEAEFALTRRWEFLQLDELPIGMLVLAACLIWLLWRRDRYARHELRARQLAELQLAAALTENRRMAQEHVHSQERERKHLARELHDQLGQYLNAIKLDAVLIAANDGSDMEASRSASRAIIDSVDHVHGAVGEMIRTLRPVGLDDLGLVAAVENCVDQWRQRQLHADFTFTATGTFDELDESVALTVYRLVQEGLTNIHKHADAQQVDILLERPTSGCDAGFVLLTVADDGRGMTPGTRVRGFGLLGMRERVEMSGGTFTLESTPDHGLRFVARLPVNGAVDGQ